LRQQVVVEAPVLSGPEDLAAVAAVEWLPVLLLLGPGPTPSLLAQEQPEEQRGLNQLVFQFLPLEAAVVAV
jgi:hypothetical protein